MWTSFIIVAFGVGLCGAVLFAAAWYAQRKPQEVDPNGSKLAVPGSPERTLILPSTPFVTSMRAHIDRRREELARLLRSSELRRSWLARGEADRRSLLRAQRSEVCLAVSGFISGDMALLQEACPELSDDALDRLALPGDAALKLFQQLADGKLGAPRETSVAALEELIASHLKTTNAGKQDRSTRGSFLPVFRRSCLIAFAVAVASYGQVSEKKVTERRTFFLQLGRGVAMWGLSVATMRLLPRLTEVDWSSWIA